MKDESVFSSAMPVTVHVFLESFPSQVPIRLGLGFKGLDGSLMFDTLSLTWPLDLPLTYSGIMSAVQEESSLPFTPDRISSVVLDPSVLALVSRHRHVTLEASIQKMLHSLRTEVSEPVLAEKVLEMAALLSPWIDWIVFEDMVM